MQISGIWSEERSALARWIAMATDWSRLPEESYENCGGESSFEELEFNGFEEAGTVTLRLLLS